MKIALITPARHFGGREVFSCELNCYLNSKGFNSRLYTNNDRILACSAKASPLPPVCGFASLLLKLPAIIGMLKEAKIDVVILNGITIARYASFFWGSGMVVYSILHTELGLIEKQLIPKSFIFLANRFCPQLGSHKVFSVSRTNMPYLGKRGIYLGSFIDSKLFPSPTEAEEKDFDFLYVGRFSREKRIDRILRSFAEYLGKYGDEARLLLIGEGPLKEEMVKLSQGLGIEENVEFWGFMDRERLINCYRRSKCFMLLSESEGAPLVVLEALSQGIPCIVTNVGNCKDIIRNNFNGYLVAQNDDTLLIADCMRQCVECHADWLENCINSVADFGRDKVLNIVAESLQALREKTSI